MTWYLYALFEENDDYFKSKISFNDYLKFFKLKDKEGFIPYEKIKQEKYFNNIIYKPKFIWIQ